VEAGRFGSGRRTGLAEHRGFCCDTADAPTEYRERIHHRGVRIGANHGVWIRFKLLAARHRADDASEILEIDLVADAGVRWNDFEILKRGLAPAKKRISR